MRLLLPSVHDAAAHTHTLPPLYPHRAAFLREEAASIAKSGRDENTEKVQASLDSAENRYSRLLTRYRLEKEGYHSEAALLRKRLAALDVQYKKIKDNNGSNSPSTKQSQC